MHDAAGGQSPSRTLHPIFPRAFIVDTTSRLPRTGVAAHSAGIEAGGSLKVLARNS